MLLFRHGRTYFFSDCALFVDGKYVGSGSGAGEIDGKVLECYGDNVVLRLGEDGYINYEGGVLEIGLLRDCGGAGEIRQFEDGVIYVYSANACGWGVFEGTTPVVYSDINYPMSTATFGSMFLTLAGLIRETK